MTKAFLLATAVVVSCPIGMSDRFRPATPPKSGLRMKLGGLLVAGAAVFAPGIGAQAADLPTPEPVGTCGSAMLSGRVFISTFPAQTPASG